MTYHHTDRTFSAFNGPGHAPQTPREIADELLSAFNDHAARHRAEIARLEQVQDEHTERLQGLMIGGVGGGDNRGDDYKASARAFFSAVLHRPATDADVDYEALRRYEGAFEHYIRRGKDALPAEIHAAMQVGSEPDGGYWAPPEVSRNILKRMFETSDMRRLTEGQPISGPSIKFPLDTNDATSGGWVGETESRPETASPQIGEQEIFLREQYAMPKVSQKLLDDSTYDVGAWLESKIGEKLGRGENTAYVSGNGVNEPRGFVDYGADAVTTDDATRAWGVLQYVPTGASAGFPKFSGSTADDADSLITLQHKLKPKYLANAVWVMARSTAAVVRKLKDKDDRYIWIDNLTEGGRPLLLGHPVEFFEDMPAIAANSFSIAFGDFKSGYAIIDHRAGLRILRDPFTSRPFVNFYVTKRTGGDVRDFDAIKLLKFGAS